MNIHELVKKAGSQAQLARAFGVSRMAVTHWVQAGELPQQRRWQLEAGAVKLPESDSQAILGAGKASP